MVPEPATPDEVFGPEEEDVDQEGSEKSSKTKRRKRKRSKSSSSSSSSDSSSSKSSSEKPVSDGEDIKETDKDLEKDEDELDPDDLSWKAKYEVMVDHVAYVENDLFRTEEQFNKVEKDNISFLEENMKLREMLSAKDKEIEMLKKQIK